MKNYIRGVAVAGALAISAISLGACSYGGMAAVGDRVVVARNDGFLFGALRKVYVCDVTANGVANCKTAETP